MIMKKILCTNFFKLKEKIEILFVVLFYLTRMERIEI